MKNLPLVSVVIPCYNDGDYIEDAIQSIKDQSYSNTEIIVIDDGSNIPTKKILKELIHKIDTLISQENQGVVKARNTGIRTSKGEYILTLDADDFFDSSFIDKAVKILEEQPAIGMVTCTVEIINKNGKSIFQTPSGAGKNKVINYNNAYGCLMYRKRCWQEVGGYDENMALGYEDWEFNIAVSKAGWKVHVIQEKLFNYRNKLNSRNKTITINNNIELSKYVYKKHKDLYIENYEETIDVLFEKIRQARLKSIDNIGVLSFLILKLKRFLRR
jgi:glycosyltransferase involved in cell wall biosynthesis